MLLPFVREFFADVEKSELFARLVSRLKSVRPPTAAGAARIRVSGLIPTAKALCIVLLQKSLEKPLLLLVESNRAAEVSLPVLRAFCELTGAVNPADVVALPAYDVLPFENLSPHPEIQETRASALWKIATGKASIVIAPISAAAMRLRVAEYYAGLTCIIRPGETLNSQTLAEHLNSVGYTAADVVEMPGQYALRGGIFDVYPPEAEQPFRVESFGDEVESIRTFDPASQRSKNPREQAVLLPLTETPVAEETLAAINARLSGKRVSGEREQVERSIVAGGVSVFPGWELYSPLAEAAASLFDLLPRALVLMDESATAVREIDLWWEKVTRAHESSNIGSLVRPEELYLPPEELKSRIHNSPGALLEELSLVQPAEEQSDNGQPHDDHFAMVSQPTPRFHGSMSAMADEVRKLLAENRKIIFAVPNLGEAERMADILGEYGIAYRLGSRAARGQETYSDEASQYFAEESAAAPVIVKAFVPQGVALPDSQLVIFGALDLFDESEAVLTGPVRRKSKVSAFLSDFRDLAVGDYVVHVEHGIGQYCGLKEISPGEDEPAVEFMLLEYAEGARLYVPLTRLDLVQKYRSAEGARPALSRLGTAAWAKTKARVKSAMKDMADELLKLYAERKNAAGHAFAPDGQWQGEFEDAFEYNETPDQTQSTIDVKRDMESSQPMDRLLCGDVGYGKTEVAMRAAFKAVSDNKQVAVLAPTTVLAFQHLQTFRQRFAQFPIAIEMLSRFRTAGQQREIVQKVEAGKIDIIIGTHRLLSKDIKFADLGLVIVDEEQRFGVRHKEKLKQLKREVDVLTLSATPIPRTLHMSLVGLRDMSVIETPPKDRMAIQTVVAAFGEKLIKSAIEHELERGGQTYFVYNRVETIYELTAKIQQLVPAARVLVGHGQMSQGDLEKIMLKFMRHEADVLVSTTIIENGLDIPLCNTIIVNRAERHGLGELYQLRGRVGRSNRRAYAYLLVPPEAELTPVARRRLAALKEFSDLGAGFKIAALDLELRGAGNMLGGQQSGHIDAVGFEMYTSLLDRTVRDLKGESVAPETDTQLNLGLNIRVPAEYIAEENQRLRIYKRVAGVENEKELEEAKAELVDRYGPPPPAAQNLLQYAELRLLCRRLGVTGIDRRRDQFSIRFREDAAIDPEKLAGFVAGERGAQFTPGGILKFSLKAARADEVLSQVRSLLSRLAGEELRVA